MDNNLLKIEQNIEQKRNNVGRIDSIQTFDAKNEKELLRQIESQSIAKRCGVGKDVLELPRPMKRPYDMVCLCMNLLELQVNTFHILHKNIN